MVHAFESSAVAAQAAIRRGDVTTQELTSYFLARIEGDMSALGAVRDILAGQAIEAARAIDELIRTGAQLPPLAGVPVIIKENCDTFGAECSAGLSFRKNHITETDSAITNRLRAAGAIVLGTSVSDPGAFGVRTMEVIHPYDSSLTVGGSSGGSAASLAAGFCLGAIGTDTGGSIRIPSACCGTVGLKPTFGALPMSGIFPLVPSLDHVGPMARSVADLQLLWNGLSGTTSVPSIKPKRIGYDPAWVEVADEPIRSAFALGCEKIRDNGIALVEVTLPNLDDIVSMHGRVFVVEAAAYHCARYGEVIGTYPPIAREWFSLAREMPVAAYLDACQERVSMTRAVDNILDVVDAIITPTLCVARPLKSAETLVIAGKHHDYIMALVRLTCLFDHTGHPTVAFPVSGTSDALVSSLQIVGAHGQEDTALRIASLLADDLIY